MKASSAAAAFGVMDSVSAKEMPFDFDEILGLIAPRPVLAWAPTLDCDHLQDDVRQVVERARDVYDLYGDAEVPRVAYPLRHQQLRLPGGSAEGSWSQ